MRLKDLIIRKKIIITIAIFTLFAGIVGVGHYYHRAEQLHTLRKEITQLTTTREKRGEPIPPIAVAMTTYNRADFLPRAIDSVLKQTKTDFHFIIVDDGSTDDTLALLYEYMQKDNRIRVYPNTKNQGISAGRNRLLDLTAAYQYQANLDSDDYVSPHWLAKEYEYMRQNLETVVVTVQNTTTANPKKLFNRWVQHNDDMALYFFMKCPMSHSGTMFRRLFLKQNDIRYDTTLVAAEDYDLWVKILTAGGRFHVIEQVLLRYRQHATNSHEYYDKMAKSVVTINKKLFGMFYPIDKKGVDEPLCVKLKKAQASEFGNKIFTPRQWQRAIEQRCPSAVLPVLGYFIDTNRIIPWADYLIKIHNSNEVYRFSDVQKMTIIRQTPDEIILKSSWWDKMTFRRKAGTSHWTSE